MVSRMADISPTEAIRYDNKDMMVRLVDAMIRVECGQPVERRIIEKGYDLAMKKINWWNVVLEVVRVLVAALSGAGAATMM